MSKFSEKKLVFSYGSNMYNPRLKKRVPSAQTIGIGKLVGYTLEFSKRSKDGSGKATVCVTKNKRDVVWGTISKIKKSEKHLLDKVEGLNNGYLEGNSLIKTDTGEEFLAFFYIAEESFTNRSLKPYSWYKYLVVAGAKLNHLPAEYIRNLEAWDCIEDPDQDRNKKEISIIIEQ